MSMLIGHNALDVVVGIVWFGGVFVNIDVLMFGNKTILNIGYSYYMVITWLLHGLLKC